MAWLAIAWSVLRLEPVDIVTAAGLVILFGAVTEAIRALAGTRTWWLNAGMAVLFALTGVIVLLDNGGSWATPAALIGWYLMVRGAADLGISMMTRETDRIWGMLTVVGLAELALGFFAASSYARTAEVVILVLGGTALLRGVADLVASLRLHEFSAAMDGERLLELTPERAVGVAGYSAGLTDFEAGRPPRGARARHRATPTTTAAAAPMPNPPMPNPAAGPPMPEWPLTQPPSTQPPLTVMPAAGPQPGSGEAPAGRPDSFHDEVLRTTADLDAMLAQAGVTGTMSPGPLPHADERIEVPDTPEGAELPDQHQAAAAAAAAAQHQAAEVDDTALPLLDSAARAGETASPGAEDTAIIAKRWVD
ncbi:HdeD family acid-resistance protein [Actinoplanes sp. NPDC049668]|uniref:HdeD family acid-resistance protein n=1 Tax=unclassified Actinoplanes TaxID=2626549 RepID=UPI0033B3E962